MAHKGTLKQVTLVVLGGFLVLAGVWANVIYTRVVGVAAQTTHPYDLAGWVAGIAGMVCFAAVVPIDPELTPKSYSSDSSSSGSSPVIPAWATTRATDRNALGHTRGRAGHAGGWCPHPPGTGRGGMGRARRAVGSRSAVEWTRSGPSKRRTSR